MFESCLPCKYNNTKSRNSNPLQNIYPIMKPEDKKEIEAIERELHQDGQQVRTAIDPSKNYK